MSKKYYNIAIDRVRFKFSDSEIFLHNKLYERYNKISNQLDNICPENELYLFRMTLIRIANIQSIVNRFRGKGTFTKPQRRKSISNNENEYTKPIHISVDIPAENIKILGHINYFDFDNFSFSKYDCFEEFYQNEKLRILSLIEQEEKDTEDRDDDHDEDVELNHNYRKNSRDVDYTTEDDIMRALANGDGDLYGF